MGIVTQLIGYPRIGPQRELKWALERMWSGRMERAAFEERLAELRDGHLAEQRELIGSAIDDFFLYDEALESALMLGRVPDDLAGELFTDPFGVLSALARGTARREAWEMTKWFDTNYHFVVPEIERLPTEFRPLPWREPISGSIWPILGPFSLVKLARLAPGIDPGEVAGAAGAALWAWVRSQGAHDPEFRLQVDEPCLGLTLDEQDRSLRDAAYAGARHRLANPPIVTVQFGEADLDTLEQLGNAGFAVQVPLASLDRIQGSPGWDAQPELVVSVMDGRSVWPDRYGPVRALLVPLVDDSRTIRLVPSTSLMFLPYTIAGENLPGGFQFAREKARTLASWGSTIPAEGPESPQPPTAEWPDVGELRPRVPRSERRAAQADLDIPPFPTTTIGSLPQTADVRGLRARLDRGEIDRAAYRDEIRRLITDAIHWQESIGLDVLVHGEFERTDMVEYFAERMPGFLTTHHGWVQSYGSRCVRPPILAAPPSIVEPMTVEEWRIAQEATRKPVKGMLTGPVTIVNWSFRPPNVTDDRLFWAVAQPVAQEVTHLVEAGARVIQIDEPAVRERWPLPTVDADRLRAIYAEGVRAALNHVFNQPAAVQMHTHMCYGTDAGIAALWNGVGVDVASIWYARSHDDERIRAFYLGNGDGYLQIGPGLFDVHSPHSPGGDVMDDRLSHFLQFMDAADLWANPDCGLKTRTWEEVERQLGDMVAAAMRRRGEPAPRAAGAGVGESEAGG